MPVVYFECWCPPSFYPILYGMFASVDAQYQDLGRTSKALKFALNI